MKFSSERSFVHSPALFIKGWCFEEIQIKFSILKFCTQKSRAPYVALKKN